MAMPLEEYRRKRDFGKTPEPDGSGVAPVTPPRPGVAAASTPGAAGGRFVIQRHRATRLHYDVRLEIGGVLVSWAVPRGPSLDPDQRRMAIHVEDHPLEYFDFEGVIPARQYGAGDVIVWDWGTFEPEAETPHPLEAIAAGELKFRLDGQKVRGRFTIVRTSGRGRDARRRPDDPGRRAFEDDEGEQWLLIHKKDAEAVAGWDAEDHPTSVKTGRTNDDVKAKRDALWISEAPAALAAIDLTAARPEALPNRVEPMLATLATKPFRSEDWLFEIKWDGYRVQAVVGGEDDQGGSREGVTRGERGGSPSRQRRVRTWTRNGADAETYFPRLLNPPTWIAATTAVVDGEVVALDAEGRPDFNLLQERISERSISGLVFQAFDLLHLDGRSLLAVPLEDRKRLLRSVLRDHPRVRFATHVETEGVAFHEAAAAQGLEGVIAKHRRSRYEPGKRTPEWLKLKIRPEQELVVGGWTPGDGSARELGAVVVGVTDDQGRLRFAGKVGSGFDGRTRKELRARLDALATEICPFDPAPEAGYRGRWGGDLKGVTWVRPELVIRAELGGWSRDGIVRQGSFKGFAVDRRADEVVREEAVESPAALTETATAHAPLPEPALKGSPAPGPSAPRRRRSRAFGGPAPAGDTHLHAWEATPGELAALARLAREGTWSVGGFDLKLTNLDKPLFPPGPDAPDDPPITKRELIGYFARIAPTMLPHVHERPLNLNRFPDGAFGKSFWQKDIPSTAPAWLRRWREIGVEARDANEHLIADRIGALCWLGNQASFEVHAWTSRLDAPWRPTFALIDIDPGERTTWEETLVLTRLYRTALEHLGVRGYPKVTGKRGIQVWIPVVARYSFADTSAWVERLSRAVGATVPDLVSWAWVKGDRAGKARLDYTQNAPIKTLVAPYAVRPAAGAPVSAPISWDELDEPTLRPDRWTIRTIVERVQELGDLFAPAQSDLQELPTLS